MVILAIDDYKTNADLMVACRDLGYIDKAEWTVDLTYGQGGFWTEWRPELFIGTDLDPGLLDPVDSIYPYPVDFTDTPPGWVDLFGTVVLDPPYKLNGTPSGPMDDRYGVGGRYVGIEGRHWLMRDGITEATRILRPGGHLLFKCQDQVSSGKVQWQTRIMADHAESCGLDLVDALLFPSYRPQPEGRRQIHARRNYSTLLVFKKPKTNKTRGK